MVEKKMTTKTVTTEEVVDKDPVMIKKVVKKRNNSNGEKGMRRGEVSLRVEEQLIENFVSLQKVLTSMSFKFEEMTKKLSEVLDLFEESAKAFVKKDIPKEQPAVIWQKEVLEKIDNLFEQNKILARGLTLIHEEATKAGIPTSPSIMNSSQLVSAPFRGEMIKSPIKSGIPEKQETVSLSNKPRVKEENSVSRIKEEEEPVFDVQESPFFVKK